MKRLTFALLALAVSGTAFAKLPPQSDEQKAAAALAREKAAHGDKVASYKLCLAQDKVASKFAVKGKTVETPACADPGPFVPAPAVAAAPAPAGTAPAAAPAAAAPAAAPAPAAPVATAAAPAAPK